MTNIQPLSQVYADLIDREVERLLEIQAEDGSFQTDGIAFNYEQNALYPLALAYLRADGQYEEDLRLLDAIGRSGDYHAFNPYNQAGTSGTGGAFAAFEVPLNAARPEATVRIIAPTA